MDKLIKLNEQKSITDIIKLNGWRYFRELEYKTLKRILLDDNMVVSTGGGIIIDLDQNNNEIFSERKYSLVKRNCITVFLKISLDLQIKRIRNSKDRPSLVGDKNPEDEIKKIMQRRTPFYRRFSDVIVNITSNHTIYNINKIINIINKYDKR